MKQPQFAERQYEAAAYIEISRGKASPFVPTQNIEAYLGIDAAADPEKVNPIWRILSVKIPRRIPLSPLLWPKLPRRFHDEIPGFFCSLFLQFKRPKYQDNKRSKHYLRIGCNYFEVGITPHQQKVLQELETRVGRKAVVRYASPKFWSRKDFDDNDEKRQVLANSAFIAPIKVKSHRKWIYDATGLKVILNPEPEDVDQDSWENVLGVLRERALRQSLREHVRSLAENLREIEEPQNPEGDTRWLRRLTPYGEFSEQDNLFLLDLSIVSLAAVNAEAIWIVLLLPDDEWSTWFKRDHHINYPFFMRWWPF